MFYALFLCGHYFFNTGLSNCAFSTYYIWELVFCLFCSLQHLYIITVYVSVIWPSVILLSLDENFLFVKISNKNLVLTQ